MDKDWTLREELYRVFHQWPSMIAFALVGCLLGWVAALLWPSYHRATARIYVAIDPYRAYSDAAFLALSKPKFRNIDDYKNWQLSQLEFVIYQDTFMDDTLAWLRREDPYWEAVSRDELRGMLQADWHTTGIWELNAEHEEAQRASQAAAAWGQVALGKVQAAVQAARDTFMIDQERQEIVDERIQSERRLEALIAVRNSLEQWRATAPESGSDEVLSSTEREHLYARVVGIAQFNPTWTEVLNAFPAEQAPTSAYQDWIDSILAAIGAEMPLLEARITTLKEQQVVLQSEYDGVANASQGLSPNITFEGLENLPAEVLRPTSQFMLLGGFSGFFLWILVQVVRVARKGYPR